MRDANGNPIWNLYLEEVNEKTRRIVMPDTYGLLPANYSQRKTGEVLSWPLNPHFTGESGIAEILKSTPNYKDFTFVY